MATEPMTVAAAFLAGLAGSAHCAAMCGGIAGAVGAGRSAALLTIGRVSGYMVAGAIAGAAGVTLATALGGQGVLPWLRVAFGAALVLVGLRTLTNWRGPRWLEDAGLALWRSMAPTAAGLARHPGTASTLALGFLWGWLPCGLVYAMLGAAIFAGSALEGVALMGAFGLGTAPAVGGMLLAAGAGAAWLRGVMWRRIAGGLLVGFGLWTAALPLFAAIGPLRH